MPWCQALRSHVINQIIDLDSIFIEAFKEARAFNEIIQLSQIMRLLVNKWCSNTTPLNINTTEGH